MKTIKELIALNDAHTVEMCVTIGGRSDDNIRSRYNVLTSFKYGVKLVGDTEDICIYTNKDIRNMDIPQVMDMLVSIDRRYNIYVLEDV